MPPQRRDRWELPAWFKSRRVVILAGMGVALLAGLAVAFVIIGGGDDEPAQAPPASQGGLVVQTGRDDDVKLDERRPLHCYVGGKLIGELTLSDCARRNGVAAGALDVGLDRNGALAGTSGASLDITPLPPADMASASAPIEENATAPDAAPAAPAPTIAPAGPKAAGSKPAGPKAAACWRYGDSAWTRTLEDETLAACVRRLYAGQCDPSDTPAYGRWGDRTMRLVQGRVEMEADDRSFATVAAHVPGCPPPPRG